MQKINLLMVDGGACHADVIFFCLCFVSLLRALLKDGSWKETSVNRREGCQNVYNLFSSKHQDKEEDPLRWSEEE